MKKRLKDLKGFLEKVNIPYIIMGGVAVAVHGEVRFTRDVDVSVFLNEERLKEFIKVAEQFGFVWRTTNLEELVEKARVILLVHKKSNWPVDITLAGSQFEREVFSRAKDVNLSGVPLRVISAEDLIFYKWVAGRPRDLEDIRSILRRKGGVLDLRGLKKLVRQYSSSIDQPGRYTEFQKLLSSESKK